HGTATTAAAPAAAAAPAEDGAIKGSVDVIEPTRTQQLIARRMASAKATIPEFQVTVEVDAEAAFELREQLRGQADPLPSVNDLLIKACALGLREHPRVNGAYVDGRFELYGRVNIGMAVAGEGTLVVPTIFDADRRSLVEIAASTRALAAKVRDGTVSPPELAGGTFTVSNLGMFGVARFSAVINPPQAAILAVGTASPRAVVADDGTVSSRRVMELTISADHRIVYGADAADFLTTVRKRLERPAGLLL
ncbi:MAG: dihydrolipoamide acetyltransferase family protein, partial [Solirubrobacteraceae bacterium]